MAQSIIWILPAGIALSLLGCLKLTKSPVEFVSSWGHRGVGDGEFQYIEDFALDASGNLLVTDALRADIQVFSLNGRYLSKFGGSAAKEGKDKKDKFEKPEGVAVDPEGNIFVADYLSSLIKKFSKDRNHMKTFSSIGSKPGQTIEPEFMDFTPNGYLYVADAGNHRIDVFDRNGTFKFSFGGSGNEPGKMHRPEAAKYSAALKRIYVTDYGNHRMQIFTLDGKFIQLFGSEGDGPGQVRKPTGITIDKNGDVYVCDLGNSRINVYNAAGQFKYSFGKPGHGNLEFENLHGIIVDSERNLYIGDTGNNRIQKVKVLY